jgi:hypothetical protein
VVNSALSKMSSSGFKGVFRIRAGRYAAHITHHGHQVSLGYFATAEEASLAYQEASVKLRGEFSRTK